MTSINKRSIERVKLDIKALQRSGADALEVMADLNRSMWKIIVDSIKAEPAGKDVSEEKLVEVCRNIALLGRRDIRKQ
jgi:hypothetical protein